MTAAVRSATTADAQTVGRVFDAAVAAGWTFLGDLAQRPMFTADHWDELVADLAPPDALLVAVDAIGTVIGFTAIRAATGELYLLFVHPEHGGRGVGRALLDAAHRVLRAAGRDAVFLFTEERNTHARAVYAAAGYQPDGVVRESDFAGEPLRELRLVADLG